MKRPGDRLSEAPGVLARSYQDHPNFIDFFPDEKVCARALPDVCTAGLRDALGYGHVYAAMRGGKIVGVATQGLGAGTRLLEPVLSLADAAGQSCYLETQTERNVAWYRQLGFEVKEAGVRFVPAVARRERYGSGRQGRTMNTGPIQREDEAAIRQLVQDLQDGQRKSVKRLGPSRNSRTIRSDHALACGVEGVGGSTSIVVRAHGSHAEESIIVSPDPGSFICSLEFTGWVLGLLSYAPARRSQPDGQRRLGTLLENTYAVIYGVGEGPRERRPQMVDMLNMIGAAQWFRYVTGALGLALRLKTPKPDELSAQQPTPTLAG